MAHTIDHKEEEARGIWSHIEEKSNKVLNTGKKVIPFAQKIWEDTKEFKDGRNPLNWGHNVGAVGARGVESFFTFDAENPRELSMELVEKAMGKRGIHYSIAKEVPGLKPILVKAEDLASQAYQSMVKRIQGPQLQPAFTKPGGNNVFQAKSYTPESGNAEIIRRQQLDKPLSADIDPDELIRRKTLKDRGFKMERKQLKSELLELQDKGMSFEDAKKQLLGDEPFWIDNRTGEPIALQYNTKDPTKPYMPGQWSRRQRGGKRTLLTEQQSLGPDEIAFTKYNAKTNKVELLVKKGDEIHHWNSIIDKSSAYVGLNADEAKELTGLVREAGWMFGDNKANLIKMVRSDHKLIHAFMRENGIEGVKARKMMEELYAGKSVKERFKILRGFMEHVQGAVDEELVRMGYQIPKSHAAAQAANREVLRTIEMP